MMRRVCRAVASALVALLALGAPGCRKAPLFDIRAEFQLADTSWFAEEDTLFVFYQLSARQGLNESSVVEIKYTTDDGEIPWTALSDLPSVHTHVPVDCGPNTRCGSKSLYVPKVPRDVRLRFRYDRVGRLAVEAPVVFNVVGTGHPWIKRSLIAYGVFDETNQRVEWRARNQFPTIRNEQATELGLRRSFQVSEPSFGTAVLASTDNPYGYGVDCPVDWTPTGFHEIGTTDRAVFYPDTVPVDAFDASSLCAEVTVTDARGPFTTGALARKNPEVRPAFPVLRSPIRDATPIPFFLGPCDRTISVEAEAMMRQRLQLGDVPTTCTDDWQSPTFVGDLVVTFRDAVEAVRPDGNDMVLTVAINQDDPTVSDAVEQALAQVVPLERARTSPRLAGAFVLDSDIRGITLPELSAVTLWCPSTLETDTTDYSTRSCAVAPDNLSLDLGPFSFGTLPILPPRDQYLDFIDTYSVKQAGEVTSMSFRVPEFAASTRHIDLEDFGVVTFLNGETITADPADAFSYCTGSDVDFTLFQSDVLRQADPSACDYLGFPEEDCAAHVLPMALLPDWHMVFGETQYDLGIFWEFPFLLQMDYQTSTAGAVSAFGFSVPFGFASPGESYYGSDAWSTEGFDLANILTQCDRFCDHPTFDSAGVYHVTEPFRTTYADSCYLPLYPAPGDSGFPLDP
jgi:hypothetical protein